MASKLYRMNSKLQTLLIFSLLISACSSLKVQRAQTDIREKMAQNDAEAAMQSVIKSTEKGLYSPKDEVLMKLELGTTAHFNGQFETSANAFKEAEERMEELVTRSAGRAAASIIGNDNQLDYDGTDFEQVYVNAFNTLNYLQLQDLEGAAVETRKMVFKLDEMQRKFNENLDNEINMDFLENQSKNIDWADDDIQSKLGDFRSRIRNSAWARYLATLVFTKNNDPDDARIEFQSLNKALAIQQDLAWGDFPANFELNYLLDADSYNVLLVAYTGASPQLFSVEFRDFITVGSGDDVRDIYVKYALPHMELMPINAAYVDVEINGLTTVRLPLIEHTDELRYQFFQKKKATIYARSFARATAKTIGVEALKSAVRKDDDDDDDDEDDGAQLAMEAAAGIFGFLLKEGSEQADLRSWQSLPAKIHASTIKLAAGEHQLTYKFYTVNEQLIDTIKKSIMIEELSSYRNQLLVNEVFLWN